MSGEQTNFTKNGFKMPEINEELEASGLCQFPLDFPKYTTSILNKANRFAGATEPDVCGSMHELVAEFRVRHPTGNFDDWVRFYMNQKDGKKRLDRSSRLLYSKVHKMRKSFNRVDEAMCRRYVEDLVLYKSYNGFNIQRQVLNRLGERYGVEVKQAPKSVESDGVDGYVASEPVSVKPVTYPDDLKDNISVPIVYYDTRGDTDYIEIKDSELATVRSSVGGGSK